MFVPETCAKEFSLEHRLMWGFGVISVSVERIQPVNFGSLTFLI